MWPIKIMSKGSAFNKSLKVVQRNLLGATGILCDYVLSHFRKAIWMKETMSHVELVFIFCIFSTLNDRVLLYCLKCFIYLYLSFVLSDA